MRIQTYGESRAELVMTAMDRTEEIARVILGVLSPFFVVAVIYFWEGDRIEDAIWGGVFATLIMGFSLGLHMIETPFKVLVDAGGITRQLFWTGRIEHLPFQEITLVKCVEAWGTTRVSYRIYSTTKPVWGFSAGYTFVNQAPLKTFFDFVDEMRTKTCRNAEEQKQIEVRSF